MKKHSIKIFILIFFFALSNCCEVVIHAHELCESSIKAMNIVNKIQNKLYENNQNDSQKIKFTKLILNASSRRQQQLVYPTIKIKDKNKQFIYQNQLTLVELQYWINVICLKKIPKCDPWMTHPIYPLHVNQLKQNDAKYSDYLQFLQFIIQNPAIKICTDPKLPLQTKILNQQGKQLFSFSDIQNTISILLNQLPVFLKFTHNIRNYLLNKQKTAILLGYNPKVSEQVNLKDKLLEIVQYIRKKDQRLSFHLSDKARSQIIFVIDKTESKIVKKLFDFLNIDQMKAEESGCIVAFRFSENNQNQKILEGFQYKLNQNTVLDNKFVFWLQQIASSVNNVNLKYKLNQLSSEKDQLCKQNFILHQFQLNNIQSVLQNIQLLKIMKTLSKKVESQFYQKQIFTRTLLFYNQTKKSSNQNDQKYFNQIPNEIRQIILSQTPSIWTNYFFNFQFQNVISKQMRYNRLPPFKLCLKGQQSVRFVKIQQLFQYLINKSILKIIEPQEQQISKQDMDIEINYQL